jgi:hypothetical protein
MFECELRFQDFVIRKIEKFQREGYYKEVAAMRSSDGADLTRIIWIRNY